MMSFWIKCFGSDVHEDNLYRQTQWGPLYSSTNQRKEGSQRTQIGHQRKLRSRTFYIGGGPPNHPFYHHFSSSNGQNTAMFWDDSPWVSIGKPSPGIMGIGSGKSSPNSRTLQVRSLETRWHHSQVIFLVIKIQPGEWWLLVSQSQARSEHLRTSKNCSCWSALLFKEPISRNFQEIL